MSIESNVATSTVDNSIVSAIGKVVNQINSNPEAALLESSASSELSEGLKSTISIRNFELTSDEPYALGGSNAGPNPVELVLGALGACKEIVIKAFAVNLGIEVRSVKVQTKGKLDLKGFLNLDDQTRPGFYHVSYDIEIDTPETDSEKLQQLEALVESKCPVHDIIKNPVEVEGSVKFTSLN